METPDHTISPSNVQPEHSDSESDSQSSEVFNNIDIYKGKRARDQTNHEPTQFTDDPAFQRKWDLFRHSGSQKKKWTIAAALLATILWIVAVAVYSSVPARRTALNLWTGSYTGLVGLPKRNVTLNAYDPLKGNVSMTAYRKGQYFPKGAMVRWLTAVQLPVQEGSHSTRRLGFYVTFDNRRRLVVRQHLTSYEKVVMESTQFAYSNDFFYANDIVLNPARPLDHPETFHILRSDSDRQWRHSSMSLYWLWNPITATVKPIGPEKLISPKLLPKLHYARFDSAGENVIFTYNNDIYVMHVTSNHVSQITNSGSSVVFNGLPDWVYEEEIYPQPHMMWESPKLRRLVYASLNDSQVDTYDIAYYIKQNGANSDNSDNSVNQYPAHTSIKYPKPGRPNPIVSLFSYDLALGATSTVPDLADDIIGADFILYDAAWIDSENLLVKVADRTSTVVRKKVWNVVSGKTSIVSTTNASKEYGGWIEKSPPIVPLVRDGKPHYLDKIVVNKTVHVALFEGAHSEKPSHVISPAHYEATVSYNAAADSVVFANYSGLDLLLYSHVIGTGKTVRVSGATGHYALDASADGNFATVQYQGPLEPWQKLVDVAEWPTAEELDQIEAINNMQDLANVLDATNIPTRVYSRVRVGRSSDATELNVMEVLPPNFDPKRKYPLLVSVYGGPGSTEVEKRFSVDFKDIVAGQLNAVVLVVDPRGTGSDNWRGKSWAAGRLGFWEPRDIVGVALAYIQENGFIDDTKTAVWGWSYGGFSTLKTLEYDAGETFKYGMAVAPVTNWMFYDSVYAERYLKKPGKNGYSGESRINNFSAFTKCKRFLLMHGTADDNVHIQNTMWLLDKLDTSGVENYDMHVFPDSDHLIFYHNANAIVFDKLLWWLQRAFSGGWD